MKQLIGKGRQPLDQVMPPEQANLLQIAILGPRVEGHLVHALLDVDKAHVLVGPLEHGAQERRAAHLVRGENEVADPRDDRPAGVQRAVVARDVAVDLLGFEPAPRLEGVKGLHGDLLLKVFPAAAREPGVYKVELVGEVPRLRPAPKPRVSTRPDQKGHQTCL